MSLLHHKNYIARVEKALDFLKAYKGPAELALEDVASNEAFQDADRIKQLDRAAWAEQTIKFSIAMNESSPRPFSVNRFKTNPSERSTLVEGYANSGLAEDRKAAERKAMSFIADVETTLTRGSEGPSM